MPLPPLSVLDLAPVGVGSTPGAALASTIELARATEKLGYHRFWVAEQFGMLEALHPGRVDLGIGRAPGTDQVTAQALRRSANPLSADEFPEQLTELMGYFNGSDQRGVTAVPGDGNVPDVWLLGSSAYSAQVAGLLGLPFSFAHHFSAANTLPALALYRERFREASVQRGAHQQSRPSARLSEPYAMVCVSVIAAEDDDKARYIAGSGALSFLQLRQGKPGRVPSPEEAAAYPYSDIERHFVEDRLSNQVIGGPETVLKGLTALQEATRADELMITTLVHDPADRMRTYELVAELAGKVAE